MNPGYIAYDLSRKNPKTKSASSKLKLTNAQIIYTTVFWPIQMFLGELKNHAAYLGYNTSASESYIASWLSKFFTPGGLQEFVNRISCYCKYVHPLSFRKLQEIAPWISNDKVKTCQILGNEFNMNFPVEPFDPVNAWEDKRFAWSKIDFLPNPTNPQDPCNPYFSVNPREEKRETNERGHRQLFCGCCYR